MKNKIFATFTVSAFIIPLTFSCNKKSAACSTVKNNYRTYVYLNTDTTEYSAMPINIIKKQLKTKEIGGVETYYFDDIDYAEDKTRSSWAAAGHLNRALKIAIVAEDRSSNELRDIAKKLTYHWVFSNYHNINWWQNELGANSTLANLGLFTFDYLGKKGQDAFNGKIRESSLKYRPSVSTHTGANVFDYIDITCRNAAINNDEEELRIAFDRLKQEIRNDGIEGFQKDGSFFQHGRQVQNVSYGKSVIRVGKTLYNLRGAGSYYKLPDDKMKILSDYILNGLRASTFKGYTNYTTVSREYSRPDNLDTQKNGFGELSYFLGIENYPTIDDTYNFVSSLKKRKNAIAEDKVIYFPIAKMIVANIGHGKDAEGKEKDGVYISYKATEPNLTNTECVNGENQLGLNLSYGTNTCVMDRGDEYYNIAPIMDYNYMPGTTSPKYGDKDTYYGNDETIKKFANEVYRDSLYEHKVPAATSGNEYIYNDGQQDGITFSMTKTQHHERGNYTVSCFTTTDGMVLVGSDLSYEPKTDSNADPATGALTTTVDQYITTDTEPASTSDKSFDNHTNGNVTYTSLDDQQLTKKIERRSFEAKDWIRNNRDYKVVESTPTGAKNVATITINTNDTNKYAYAIEPKAKSGNFELIHNGDGVHAIKFKINGVDRIFACFYTNVDEFTSGSNTYRKINASGHPFEMGKGVFCECEKVQ